MADCSKYLDMISASLDGELCETDNAALHAHMDGCPDCKRVYNAFREIGDSLREELVQPPEMLSKGVMYKIRKMESGGSNKRFAFGRFTAIAACLAVVLFAAGRFGLFGGDAPADKNSELTAPTAGGETYDFFTADDYAKYAVDPELGVKALDGAAPKEGQPEATMHMLGGSISEPESATDENSAAVRDNAAPLAGILSVPLEELERPFPEEIAEAAVYSGGDLSAEPLLTLDKPEQLAAVSEAFAMRLDVDLSESPEEEPLFTLVYTYKDKEMFARAYKVGSYMYCLIMTREQAELDAQAKADAPQTVRPNALTNALKNANSGSLTEAGAQDEDTRFEHIYYLAYGDPETLTKLLTGFADAK